jgi:hypothetical protein
MEQLPTHASLCPPSPASDQTKQQILCVYRTDLGDTGVTVPLAVLMLFFLTLTKQRRLALIWAITILACAGMIGGLKVILDACGSPLAAAGLVNPSGHSAMSAAVYGGFAAVIGMHLPLPARVATVAAAALLILAIPLSCRAACSFGH